VKYLFSFAVLFLFACKSPMLKTHAFRLKPGADLKKEIQAYVDAHGIDAGWMSCGVGSLTQYHVRFANQAAGSKGQGHYEIVSLTGTVSVNGSHLHISISDSLGHTIGGHLMDDNLVYTTAEIVILQEPSLTFKREKDGTTPWLELQVGRKD
jgi:predicted DNA-binding protein with PD1-like motif